MKSLLRCLAVATLSLAGPAWVRTYEGDLSAGHLRDGMAWAMSRPPGRCETLDHLTWPAIARMTLDAYRSLAEAGRP